MENASVSEIDSKPSNISIQFEEQRMTRSQIKMELKKSMTTLKNFARPSFVCDSGKEITNSSRLGEHGDTPHLNFSPLNYKEADEF